MLKIICRIKVYGQENIPRKEGFILAGNHVSFLDPVVLGVACPRKLSYMARDTLFRNKAFALLLSEIGVFPVKRNSADRAALKEALRRLGHGRPLALFPEGTRRALGVDAKVHAGVGFLSVKANVPVIPAFVKGTETALPRGARFIRPVRVAVYFGKQIPVERRLSYQDITQQVMTSIQSLSQ
jgi:1-acyl-sn-glycerol-3-phosphate acyltransferase